LVEVLPEGSQIFNTGSTTLQEIGYTQYAKNNPTKWNNLKAQILSEQDKDKLAQLNREANAAQYELFLLVVRQVT
jgi:hypothetical protein